MGNVFYFDTFRNMTEAQYKEKAEKILRALSTTHNQVEFLLELRKQDIEEILGEDAGHKEHPVGTLLCTHCQIDKFRKEVKEKMK